MKSRLDIGHWILIFALGTLAFAATFILQYPDERHYTDGAMQMLRDHDWLVPKTPENGTANWLPRFHKPPLAYWVTAASFAAFGVNPLAARLPFLLASCGTIFLTWRLAKKLTSDASTALLAAAVLLSQLQFIFAATRAIPDALLVFFVTMSAFGFLRLIVFEEFGAGAFWLAYGGAAGAALSKGLLGAGIVLFAWAFVFAREKNFRAVKKLLHWPSLTLATALVLAWFAYILHRYGAGAWRMFFDDQVSGNLHGNILAPLWRAPVYVLIFAVNFLPWSLPALEAWWRKCWTPTNGSVPVQARNFIVAWSLALAAGFALGSNVSVRYLLPATPLVAILVADVLAKSAAAKLVFAPRRILFFALLLLAAIIAAGGFVNTQWGVTLPQALAVGTFFSAVVLIGLGVFHWRWFSASEGLALALALVFPALFFAVNPLALPDPCEQMARAVVRSGTPPGQAILLVGKPALASGLRLFLGGNFTVVRASSEDSVDAEMAKKFAAVIVPEHEAGVLLRLNFAVQPAAIITAAPPKGEWWPMFRDRHLPELQEQFGRKYMLATH